MRSFAFVWRHRVVQGMRGHNGRFGAGLSHRYRTDKWMRESCYPLCGWLSSVGLYPAAPTFHKDLLKISVFCLKVFSLARIFGSPMHGCVFHKQSYLLSKTQFYSQNSFQFSLLNKTKRKSQSVFYSGGFISEAP